MRSFLPPSDYDPNTRYTPAGTVETDFREAVRDVLGLDWSTRTDQILDELRRLKALEQTATALGTFFTTFGK